MTVKPSKAAEWPYYIVLNMFTNEFYNSTVALFAI